MWIISEAELVHALTGMPYPAHRWQLVAWADYNCASSQVREALRHLPDRTYASLSQLIDTIAAIERRAAAISGRP
jgi:hypothetical protein